MQAPPGQQVSKRTVAGILVFVLCCLLSTAHIIWQASDPTRARPDDVSRRSDQRFAALKLKLPASGVVGYLGESGDSATPDYYLAQYALAPLVVDLSADHPIVVGNFHSSSAEIPPNLWLVEDFGNGVMLFAARDAK